jgi:NTP pyrophosphatase (non-canonical NTP hydrolase)
MQIKEYCEKANRTCASLVNNEMDNVHMIFGMATEIGEITDAIKKHIAYGKSIDWINVQEEIGDLMWYIANFCVINDFKLEEILANNIKKLRIRYPEKFNEYNANNRDLNAERKILNELA